MQLLVATRNRHKLKEISAILAELNLDVRSSADVAGVPEIKEDGATLQDNAVKKAVATANANGLVETVEGICNGALLEDERGGGGFGYDPLFIPDGQVKTFAELSPDVKNRISHRAKALQKAWAVLSRYLREKGA